MKYTKMTVRLFTSAVLVMSCPTACTKSTIKSAPIIQVTVIGDVTDPLLAQPVADPILELFNFERDASYGANFRMVEISDRRLVPAEEVSLEDGKSYDGSKDDYDPDYRENRIHWFYDSVRRIIGNVQWCTSAKLVHNSECFSCISAELGRLAASAAERRIAFVYSNLEENSTTFSCYRHTDMQLLNSHPELVAQLLEKQSPLPARLTGITVVFVFNPASRDEDITYGKMVSIYRLLLTARGANVIVQASNKTYESY